MATEGVEQELKYRVADAAAAARLAGARTLGPFRAAGRARVVQVEDRYLDTAAGALGRAGWAVRLRHGPATTIVSVKSTTTATGALHRREELEGPADTSLDPHAWPPSPARSLVLAHAGGAPLIEIVTIRQLRRTRTLADASAEVELSLDDVSVIAGGEVVDRFVELEAELRRGPATALDVLAAVFAGDPDLAPERASKLERALAAAKAARPGRRSKARPRAVAPAAPAGPVQSAPAAEVVPEADTDAAEAVLPAPTAGAPQAAPESPPVEIPAPPRLIVGKTPGVTPDDVLAEAGRKVLRFHYARMLAKEAGTRSGEHIEDLHGMRVATRRMRAAWRVFGDGFRPRRTKRLRDRLRVVAGRLGAVRDLDVLLEAAATHQAGLPPAEAAAFEPLVAAWRDEREAARIILLHELDSPAYLQLVEDYRAFVVTEGEAALAPASPVSPHRVRDSAGSRIWLAYEQVRAYESILRWADIETVHQLRIAAKWLRYTLEFFREALGPEVDLLIPRVVALQDHLGLLNDADVTIAMTRQFLVANAGTLSREETHAIGSYLAGREHELARLRRTMGASWRGVIGIPFRRLLGRAVSGL
jgi:CHAD domain-containing protein